MRPAIRAIIDASNDLSDFDISVRDLDLLAEMKDSLKVFSVEIIFAKSSNAKLHIGKRVFPRFFAVQRRFYRHPIGQLFPTLFFSTR